MPAKAVRASRSDPSFHYRDALRHLNERQAPYLVGGTCAYQAHTGIQRPTKDLDIFVKEHDRDHVLDLLQDGGWETFIDVIHGAGNGIVTVDDLWFTHGVPGHVLGIETRLVPAEEMIWSKAFVIEKCRFEGADVAHLLLMRGERINWDRLLWRFGRHWRVLMGHLLFFGFIYPAKRSLVPRALMETLMVLLRREGDESAALPAGNLPAEKLSLSQR